MNSKSLIAFLFGVTIGSLVTWKLVANKYKQIAEEEIKSVKETFSKKLQKISDAKENEKIIEAMGYNGKKGGLEPMVEEKPYVIPPEEFDEEDYDTVSLTYYADGILADDWGNIVEPQDTVGEDSLTHFGEYEEDSVFVRNDALKTDYEILLSESKFHEDTAQPSVDEE